MPEIQKDFGGNVPENQTKVNFVDGLPRTLDGILEYDQNKIVQSSKFDWRAYGIIPTSRDQKKTPLCWAFGLAGIIEANILKNKVLPQYNRKTIKVDPFNIDYTTNVRTIEFDKLGLTLDDVYARKLYEGGYSRLGAVQLLQWNGPIQNDNQLSGPEQNHDFTYHKKPGTPIALVDNVEMAAITTGQPSNNLEYKKQIKELVVKYGAVGVSYFSAANDPFGDYYNSNYVSSGSHQSIIVGWDDTVSKNSFSYPANSDGAWIVRNTTETSGHLGDGCFFLSYDSPISNILGVGLVSKQTYENNYYYDGCYGINESIMKPTREIAAIFPARKASYNKKEKIKAVNFGLSAPNVSGEVKIYKNLKNANINNRFDPANDPTNGSLVTTKKFSFKNPGFYTVQLDQPIEISRNELFSVVVSIDNSVPKNAQQFWFTQEPNSYNDMTFYKENNQWKNCWGENKNLVAKIKAFTVTERIPGAPTSSNNVDFADVTLDKRFWTYKSSESKPMPTVKLEDKILVKDKDYQIEYKEYLLDAKNIESKDGAIGGMGVVLIKGIGKYEGTNQNTQYNIRVSPRPDLGSIGTYDKTNKVNIEIGPGITNFSQIVLPSCWKFTFPNDSISTNNYIEYIGDDKQLYRKVYFDVVLITNSNKIDISTANINILDKTPFTYNGKGIEPNISVSLNGKELKINTDYIVEYLNNVNASKLAEIIVKGIGNYIGLVKTQFEITKAQSKIDIVNGEFQTNFGDLRFKYFKDPKCTIEITSFDELPNNSKYWVKAYIDSTSNWNSAESQPIEKIYTSNEQIPKPPIVTPNPDENNQGNNNQNDINKPNIDNQTSNKNNSSYKSKIILISTISSIAGATAIGVFSWLIWRIRK